MENNLEYSLNYINKGSKFIYLLLLICLAFTGFFSIGNINYNNEKTNPFNAEIPAYIIPDKLNIMTWYDPSIDDEYWKKRRYHLILHHYKKSIKQLAKEASKVPFDNNAGMLMLIEHLKFMRDYYANGYNIWAMELEDHPTRQEGIEMALTEYRLAYDECVDDAEGLVYSYFEPCINTEYGAEIKLPDFNKPLNGLTTKEAFERMREEILLHRHMFYKILEQEFDTWWD